jgi:hypothetical protein
MDLGAVTVEFKQSIETLLGLLVAVNPEQLAR